MSSPLVSRDTAVARRIHHQFIPGVGYIAHSGPPELPAGSKGRKNCEPPPGTAEGSMHLLKPPTGGPALSFLWVPGEKAWAPVNPGKGNRMAWTTEFLRQVGWEYVGPVEAD